MKRAIPFFVVLGLFAGTSLAYIKHAGQGGIQHVFAEVKRGNLISAVERVGQVLSLQEVEIRSDVSGRVLLLGAKTGEYMKAGTLIARLDPAEGEEVIREAENDLTLARLDLEEIMGPPDELVLARAKHALQEAEETNEKAGIELRKSYEDGFDSAGNAFLDLPRVLTGLQEIFYATNLSGGGAWNLDFYSAHDETLRGIVKSAHENARVAHKKAFSWYKMSTRRDEAHVIVKLIADSRSAVQKTLDAVKSAENLVRAYRDEVIQKNGSAHPISNEHLALLREFRESMDRHYSTLASAETNIEEKKTGLSRAERAIEEQRIALRKTEDGPEEFETRARQLEVERLEEALREAKQNLARYEIRAPFDGILAKLDILEGDHVFLTDLVATFSTRQKIAEITLDEKNIQEVRLGQKATLTFDSIPGLSIAGEVAEIDAAASPSSNATYDAKIIFDSDDLRIKPGMKTNISIVTESKTAVLLVPNSALKQEEAISFVQTPIGNDLASLNPPLRRVPIRVGASNEEYTEILGGLEEGDRVFVRTIWTKRK